MRVVNFAMNNGSQAVWHLENERNIGMTYQQLVGSQEIETLVANFRG